MSWGFVAVAGATVVGAVINSNSQKDAAKTSAAGANTAVGEQRAAREDFNQRTEPFRQIGLAAGAPLLESLGIAVPQSFTDSLGGGGGQMGPDFGVSRLGDIDRRLAELSTPQSGGQGTASGPQYGRYASRSSTSSGGLSDEARQEMETLRQERQQITSNLRQDRELVVGQGVDTLQLDNQIAKLQSQQMVNPDIDNSAQIAALENQKNMAQIPKPDAPSQAGMPSGVQQSELERINPLVSFLRDEGFNDIQESAAAQSGLSSGGTLKDLTRFNTQLASTVVPQLQQQRFNQLFSVLGLGSNAATGQGNAALSTASNVGNLQVGAANATAQGQIAQGQAVQQGVSDLAGAFGAKQGGFFNSQPPPSYSGGGASGIQNPNQFGNFA